MSDLPANPYRVERLYLKGVGPFAELDLTFRPKVSADKADLHILVGPNGSGKSTVLYTLAALFAQDDAPSSLFFSRLRDADSYSVGLVSQSTIALYAREPLGGIGARLGLSAPWSRLGRESGRSRSFRTPDGNSARALGEFFALTAAAVREPTARHRVPYAAFAYAGQRGLSSYHLEAIREPSVSPFANALSFTNTADSGSIVQWLANAHTKEALALKAGDAAAAERYRSTRAQVERAVREVTGEDLRFEMSYEPLGITVRRGGATHDLDLLPDGVKSIVSWVADLLSRLDRTPWENDTPVLDRQFLLLLDEVDIHLHPAWQRKVLPMVQRLFKNAQIVVTTHSPFVVASVADAWVYRFSVKDGASSLDAAMPSAAGQSYSEVLRAAFQLASEFDVVTERDLDTFYALRNEVLAGAHDRYEALRAMAVQLGTHGGELDDIVTGEMLQVAHRLGRAA